MNDTEKNHKIALLVNERSRVISDLNTVDIGFLNKTSFYILGIFFGFNLIVNQTTQSTLPSILSIIFPYLLLYYTYNTLKYTLKILNSSGYVLALEDAINRLLGENLFIEYTASHPENKLTASRRIESFLDFFKSQDFYGGIIQIAFILPIGVFAGRMYCNALRNFDTWKQIVLLILLGLEIAANIFTLWLMKGRVEESKRKIINYWISGNNESELN